jgi:hypothetical protein
LVAFLAAVLLGGATALAATPVGGPGYDLSNYQCATPFPTGASFAVIQVVGAPNSPPNKCLQAQWTWANSLPQLPDLYVFAGNDSSNPATAYQHGFAAARSAIYNVACDNELNGNTGGICLQPRKAVRWWVDVEACTGYWSCPGGNANTAANIQAIKGYLDALRQYPTFVSSVGLYGSPLGDWKTITGGDTTTFPTVPYWYPDYNGDAAAAQAAHCGQAGPNGGPIQMVQGNPAPAPGSGSARIDGDARCSGGYGVSVTPGPVPLTIQSSNDRQYAGRTVTITGTGPLSTPVEISYTLATNGMSQPLTTTMPNGAGNWTARVVLQTSGTLVASAAGVRSTRPATAIATAQILHAKKVANRCAVLVDGNVRPWTVGQKITIYGPKLKPVGVATTQLRRGSPFGAWQARINVPCGKVTTLTPHISGVANGHRYALDGAGPAFKARR